MKYEVRVVFSSYFIPHTSYFTHYLFAPSTMSLRFVEKSKSEGCCAGRPVALGGADPLLSSLMMRGSSAPVVRTRPALISRKSGGTRSTAYASHSESTIVESFGLK